MTIAHRIFTPAFLRRPEVNRWGAHTNHGTQVTATRAEGRGSGITSAPWEGLYIEVNDDIDSIAAGGPLPNPDLERFLASLMFGE